MNKIFVYCLSKLKEYPLLMVGGGGREGEVVLHIGVWTNVYNDYPKEAIQNGSLTSANGSTVITKNAEMNLTAIIHPAQLMPVCRNINI